jgi:hypothetical protein
MLEGPFSENGNPNFFSSAGEEWRILGESFTACLLFLTRGHEGWHILTKLSRYRVIYQQKVIYILHSPRTRKGCHTFLLQEAILLTPFFPHSPFSENPFSDLEEGVTTPNMAGMTGRKGGRRNEGEKPGGRIMVHDAQRRGQPCRWPGWHWR